MGGRVDALQTDLDKGSFEVGESSKRERNRKRRNRACDEATRPDFEKAKVVDDDHVDPEALAWAESLSGSQLGLLVSIKRLAMQQLSTADDDSLSGVLTWKSLKCIGIIIEEYAKDKLFSIGPDADALNGNIESNSEDYLIEREKSPKSTVTKY